MQITESTVALVTGAASGLGEQTARRLLDAGAQVLLVDLPGGRGEELAGELGDRVGFAGADVRDAEQVAAAVRAATEMGELRVVVNCAGVATPGRILSRRGVVVMTASVAAFDGQVGQAAYASSKAGIVGLTLTAARDLADKGIRVMTIAPGVFETPMMAGLGEEVKSSLEALVPHPSRLGRPQEYAALVAHIVENPMLNGEVIRLDGALRMPPR